MISLLISSPSAIQGTGMLLQCSTAALALLREARHIPGRASSTAPTSSRLPSATCSLASDHQHEATGADGQGLQQILMASAGSHRSRQTPLTAACTAQPRCTMHHAAVLDGAGSDEDTSSSNSSSQQTSRSSVSWLEQPRQPRQQSLQQQHHQQQHVGQLHHMAGHHPQQQQQQQQNRYQGHLHAPHGRRHATSRSQLDKFISEQLLSCKSLGMLRRIMIKHKATMEPEHVADTVLCLQHLVRAARASRLTGARGLAFAHHATSQARSQPRVRAAGEFSRSTVRASESDGHMQQLMAQMLGELGSMIWFMMGDMTGPDLAKLLYSWAMLEWHPEPELLADAKASFLAAAAGGGLQQQNQQQQYAGQQQWAELQVWQGPWMAAGLWGLAKLGERCEGQVLLLLQQHWQQLMCYWTPQQMADVASAIAHTADEHVASAVTSGDLEAQQMSHLVEQQLAHMVLGLAGQMLSVLGQREAGGAEPEVPLPWPESMLIQVQQALLSASTPAAQRAAAAVSEIAAAGAADSSRSSSAQGPQGSGDVPMMVVHNVPHLAWRMLQALAAVGVNVSEPEDQAIGNVVTMLSAATKVPGGSSMAV